MRLGFLSSTALLLAGTGLVLGQAPATYPAGQTVRPTQYISSQSAMPMAMSSTQAVPAGPATTTVAPTTTTTVPVNGNGTYQPTVDVGGYGGDEFNRDYRFYGSGEFLLWNVQNARIPAPTFAYPIGVVGITFTDTDISTNPPTVTTFTGFEPVLIETDATLPGGNTIDAGEHTGARLTLGSWLDDSRSVGLEATYYFMNQRDKPLFSFSAPGQGQFLLSFTPPFNNRIIFTSPGTLVTPPSVTIISVSDVFVVRDASATVSGQYKEGEMHNLDLNCRSWLSTIGAVRFEGLLGARFLYFQDEFDLNSAFTLTTPPGTPTPGTTLPATIAFVMSDNLKARNYFVAPQIGGTMIWDWDRFYFRSQAKLAVGADRQEVVVDSTFSRIVPDAVPATRAGGALTGPTDNGTHNRYRFATVSEINLQLGLWFAPSIRGWIGYDYLYLNNFARSNNQSSTSDVSTSLTIGTNAPITVNARQPALNQTDGDFWIQGVNFGLEFVY